MNSFEDIHETPDGFQETFLDPGRSIVQMFQDISHGLPPAMSTNMFQCSIQSVKKLSKILLEFFSHGLLTQQVEAALILAKQFNFHRNYPLALASSLTNLAKQDLIQTQLFTFVDLLVSIYHDLGAARSLLTSPLVDIVLHWTLPKFNKRSELSQCKAALDLVKKTGQFILEEGCQSFQFLYHQVRARLLSSSKSDIKDDSNYGNFCYETKSVILDIIIVLSRVTETVSLLDFVFPVEQELKVTDKTAERNNNNFNLLGNEGDDSSRKLVTLEPFLNSNQENKDKDNGMPKSDVRKEYSLRLNNSSRSSCAWSMKAKSAIQLLTPQMLKNNLDVYIEPVESEELTVTPYQDPIDKIFHSQGVDNEQILGYLNSPNGGYSIPVQNNSCIGKDPRCTVILDGKDVSLLHARVVQQNDENIKLETLTRTHKVKVNGSLIYFGSESILGENDVVEIGKESFTWNSKLNNIRALSPSLTY